MNDKPRGYIVHEIKESRECHDAADSMVIRAIKIQQSKQEMGRKCEKSAAVMREPGKYSDLMPTYASLRSSLSNAKSSCAAPHCGQCAVARTSRSIHEWQKRCPHAVTVGATHGSAVHVFERQ